MRFLLIDAAKSEFPVRRLCQVLDVSQNGYFAWRSRPACQRQGEDLVLLAHVRSRFCRSKETYGSPRLTRELQEAGLKVGRRRTARLMRDNGLRARPKRRFTRTTDSHHAHPIAPNLLDQDFSAERPDEKWGSDISYIWTREGWLYLAVVIDLFARRVVGWAVSERLHTDLALTALRRALALRRPAPGADPPRRQRQPILLGGVSGRAQGARPPDFHVGPGQLFRQCHGGDVLQDVEIRARLAHRLPDQGRGCTRHRRLHRGILQPRPAPLRARLPQPGAVRKAGRIARQTLSTEVTQVHGDRLV